ncbi:MAG: poly-gamma-glutamate biosynthesis protein PgsC [Tissierellia bacterium]|nr:poly-gamma-glutamate biosynthesis protein PgsC [Tissierellia bacterium]
MSIYYFYSLLISLIYYELVNLSPGGIITPMYFGLFLYDHKRIGFTIIISFLAFFLVRLLDNIMILYGKRRFVTFLLIAIILKISFSKLFFSSSIFSINAESIGFIIPGLVAKDFDRQGIIPTLISLGVVSIIIKLVSLVVL